jgi:hypothetical protein
VSAAAELETREGCLRCASAPGRIRGIAGDSVATCRSCGREWLRLPLFAVSGATGVGKTTATDGLGRLLPECVRLDGDLLWRHEYYDEPDETAYYYESWLRLAVELHQHGRPLVFAGAVVPARWEQSPLRGYLAAIRYLALVCDPDVHAARLLGRDPDAAGARYFSPSLRFNEWLRENAGTTAPRMELLDTTALSPAETTTEIAAWVRAALER